MAFFQKISCNVNECAHNCIEDSTCRLEKIHVTPRITKDKNAPEDSTACAMFSDIGYLNAEGTTASRQV